MARGPWDAESRAKRVFQDAAVSMHAVPATILRQALDWASTGQYRLSTLKTILDGAGQRTA